MSLRDELNTPMLAKKAFVCPRCLEVVPKGKVTCIVCNQTLKWDKTEVCKYYSVKTSGSYTYASCSGQKNAPRVGCKGDKDACEC